MKTPAIKKFVVILSCVLPLVLPAATLTWDADTTTTGAEDGSGTWDTSTANWWTGSADTTFNIATPDGPIIGALNGAAGTVTLGAPIISSNIIFNAASVGNYTIAGGGNTLTLTNRVILANVDATISANLTGTGLTVSHGAANAPSGVLILSGDNSGLAGTLTIGENANNPAGVAAANTTCAVRPTSNTALGTGTIAFNSQGNQANPRLELSGGITLTNPTVAAAGRNNATAAVVAYGSANTMSGTFSRGTGGQDFNLASEVANGLTLSGTTGTNGIALTSAAGLPRNYVLRGSGSGTVSGNIISNVTASAANNVGIVKAGSGTWTLSGANAFAGGVIVDQGTLTLDYSSQNNAKLATTGPLTLAGGTVNLSGGSFLEAVASTTNSAGFSAITRGSGTSTLRLNAITRLPGGVIDFGTTAIADTDNSDVNGILGGYATVAGADWAHSSASASDTPITAYTGYTDITASGSTIADGATSNVRLNGAGGGGNIALGSATTTINTLLQNTATAATINTSAGTLRLGAIGGVLIPNGDQGLTFGTSVNSGTLTAGGADNVSGELVFINNSANDILVNSVVADNGTGSVSLTKAGPGTTTLAGANTYSGRTTVASGTLNVSADSNFGTAPGSVVPLNILINGGTLAATTTFTLNPNRGIGLGPTARNGNGTISVASGQTLTFAGVITNTDTTGNGPGGSLTKTGPGTLVLLGVNLYTYGTIINAGTLQVTNDSGLGAFFQTSGGYTPDNVVLNGGVLDIEGSTTLSANRGILLGPVGGSGGGTISVGSGQVVNFSGRIADNWGGTGALTKGGAGTLILGGNTSGYSGDTTVSGGMLQLANARAVPNGSDKGNIIVNSPGVLGLTTSVALKGLGGNGTVDSPSNAPVNLTLGYFNTSSSFGGTIQNSGGVLTLIKTGNGTFTFSGAGTYTGNTLINSGTLALSGSASVVSTNINVASGATLDATGLSGGLTVASGQTLSGNGSVQGNLTDGSGAILSPGSNNVAGTLTVNGNLTLGGKLNYDFTAGDPTIGGGVNDLLVANGNLTLNPGTVINVNTFGGGVPTNVTYTIMQYTGTLTGNPATALSINLGSHYTPTFANDTVSSPKRITMTIIGSPQSLIWSGAISFAWDQGTLNWSNTAAHAADTFSSGDTVTFNDSGNSSSPIDLALAVNPNSTTVNSSFTYTFGTTTAGALGGGALIKSGSGTLILDVPGTYSSTLISSGTLQVGNGDGAATLGVGLITNNATLVFNRTNTITVSTNISGSGVVTQNGTGDLTLTASNTFTGGVTANNGRVLMQDPNALGPGNAVVNAGGEIYLLGNSGVISPSAMTLNGSGPAGGGALRKGNQTTSTFGGTVTLGSDATLNVDGNGAVLNLTNAAGINGASVNANLTLTGSGAGNITGPLSLGSGNLNVSGGTWTVAPSNSFSGITTIGGGALLITAPASLGPLPVAFNAGQVTLNGGALGAADNVTLNDGKVGITVSDVSTASGIVVNNTNATFNISNNITGSSSTALTKTGPGTLVLSGPNTYAGTLNIDGNDTGNDGTTVIANNQAIANILAVPTVPYIFIRNNNAGSSTLALDGSEGSITVAPDISLAGRNNTVPAIENLAGSNTISGNITMVVGGGNYEIQSDSGTLALTAPLPLATPISLSVRTNTFLGAGNIIAFGVIQDYSLGGTNVSIMVVKQGTGILTLPAANTYTGPTVVTNGVLSLPSGGSIGTNTVTVSGSGLLVGSGTIAGPVTVQPGGAIEAGTTNTIGTLNLSSPLTLSGNAVVKISKTGGTHDLFNGQSSVIYGGTLTVTNLAGTLTTNDTFTLFSPGASASNFSSIVGSPGPGLAYSFANGVLSVVVGVANNPTNITARVSGGTLTLSWPSDHTGWILQSQTNALGVGLSSNWVDVAGSGASNTNVSTINPTNPAVFYRLRH